MAFDFPASPAVGDVSNGYVFNGVGWSGGPIIPTPTKQFFELAGVSTFDIPVPTWAKMAKITGRVWPGNAQYVAMRLSTDGVTFPAGASDYVDGGVLMNSGTGVYAPINTQTVNAMSLTQAGDVNQNTPTMIDTDINVWRPTTSQYFQAKHYGRSFAAAANSGHRGWLGASYTASASVPAGQRLSHLRIMNGLSGVPFGAGSFVNVEWMAGEIPQTNGTIPEAPQDGGQYVRVNGLWRLKEQLVNMAGVTSVDVAVPTWAKGAVLDGSVFPSTAATYAALQFSVDGTTFLAGTSYQLLGGMTHLVSGSYSTQAAGAAAYIYLDYPRTNLLVPHIFQCQLSLETNSTNQLIAARSEMQSYDNTALASQLIWQGYLNVNLTPPARVQKLRFLAVGGGSYTNGYVNVRWLG